MGACVVQALFPLEDRIEIPSSYFDKFLAEHLGQIPPAKTRKRVKMNLKRIGFL
jgi:hypothetical protein